MMRVFVEFNYKCIISDNKELHGDYICMYFLCENEEDIKIELEKYILEDFLLGFDVKDLTIDIIHIDKMEEL